MRLAPPALVCLALIAGAPAAQAAQRYASPGGTGTECSQVKPCDLKEAISKAEENDEVIVTAGAYTLTEEIFTNANGLSIHGDLAGPMPTISAKILGYAMQVSGATISYLDMTDTRDEGYPLFCIGSRVERMRLTGIGKHAIGLYQQAGCTVRDSVILASGEGATALESTGSNETSSVARNVTAIALGPNSVGIASSHADPISPGVHILDLKNSIAQGEKADLLALPGIEGPGEIFVSNSNFDSKAAEGAGKVTDLGGNQTAQPLFVNAAAGDYREAAGSPTIDAGVVDQLGPLDFAGNPRVLGAAVDIGAFETANPSPQALELRSLRLSPTTFRASNLGGAVASRSKKRRPPVGSTVTYSLSVAGTVGFTVEKLTTGRKAGKKCVKLTRANEKHKKCTLSKLVRKAGFSVAGAAGANSFVYSGRTAGKALKTGSYMLVGRSGATSKQSRFRIVK